MMNNPYYKCNNVDMWDMKVEYYLNSTAIQIRLAELASLNDSAKGAY